MKALANTVLVLVGCISLDPVLAQPPKAPSGGPSVADTINQISRDWADAEIALDVDKLSQIVADDWVYGYPGKVVTKASLLENVKSGKHKLEACEFGPQEVRVFGNVAVVQGTATETRLGQDAPFQVAYMDVFVKRGDKWVVVRSQGHKL
jgi:ketosteroid isomerase-like protein